MKNKKISHPKLSERDRNVDLLERIAVGILYSCSDLGQNDIAQIMGMGDARVNNILRGIKKPKNK